MGGAAQTHQRATPQTTSNTPSSAHAYLRLCNGSSDLVSACCVTSVRNVLARGHAGPAGGSQRPTSSRRCVPRSAHPDDLLLVMADAAEPPSLRSMCERAAVIITAVGPYQLHGPELVASCAATGTAYVDLCGEPAWMRRMIDAHHEEAKRTGSAHRLLLRLRSHPVRSRCAHVAGEGAREIRTPGAAGQSPPAQRERRHVWRHGGERSGDVGCRRARPGLDAAADRSLRVDAGVHRAVSAVGPHPRYHPRMNVWLVPFPMAPIST